MKKKTLTITAPVSVINAFGLVLIPISTQKVLAESFYLKTMKKIITISLS